MSRGKQIRKQSPEHRAAQVKWRALKVTVITEQIEAFDFAACEDCPKRFYTVEAAMNGLHAHHVKFRSQGGRNERGNLALLCQPCHDARHGIGEGDDAYWEALRLDAEEREAWLAMPEDEGGFDEEGGGG